MAAMLVETTTFEVRGLASGNIRWCASVCAQNSANATESSSSHPSMSSYAVILRW